jgi:lipopolysaccharide/colanic/teichoic acid biosynthesis glycosyltransferase
MALKRSLDIVGALLGLVLLWPFLGAIGLGILIADGRPVIYSQKRAGRNGREFSLIKFRTMKNKTGVRSRAFDPGDRTRITAFGRFLRGTKLDELPQLWNVLKGEMSFVGPRPEVREWVDAYPQRWASILEVKPGITDPASLVYRNEEGLLHASPDPEREYREVILPRKLDLYDQYVRERTFLADFSIIIRTVAEVLKCR